MRRTFTEKFEPWSVYGIMALGTNIIRISIQPFHHNYNSNKIKYISLVAALYPLNESVENIIMFSTVRMFITLLRIPAQRPW